VSSKRRWWKYQSKSLPVASLMHWKSEYSKTSPLAITGMDKADTTSAMPSHCVGPLHLSATILKPKHNMSISLLKSSGPIIITTELYHWPNSLQLKALELAKTQVGIHYYTLCKDLVDIKQLQVWENFLYLPWTAIAAAPVFSICPASSTLSWWVFNRQISHVTGMFKLLSNVVKFCRCKSLR